MSETLSNPAMWPCEACWELMIPREGHTPTTCISNLQERVKAEIATLAQLRAERDALRAALDRMVRHLETDAPEYDACPECYTNLVEARAALAAGRPEGA